MKTNIETENSSEVETEVVTDNQPADENAVSEVADEISEKPVDEWVPDYSFKVRDEQKEFDDFVKPIVNKENHAKIKELYEKAHGLDIVKSKLDEYSGRIKEYEPKVMEAHQLGEAITKLDTMLAKGDFTSFQKTLKINDDLIIKRAAEILKYREMDENSRKNYDQEVNQRSNYYSLENENLRYRQMIEQQAVESRKGELNSVLVNPNISSIASTFDQRAGKQGAFMEKVWQYGAQTFQTQGIDLSAEEAVNGYLRLTGLDVAMNLNNNQPPQQQTQKKPTLPNITGGDKSVASKGVKSLDDLRARMAQG